MKNIEVDTSHNVIIEFVTADVGIRILAYGLDLLIQIFYSVLIYSIFEGMRAMQWLLISPVTIFYSLFWEIFNDGQSLGKKLLGIKVISKEGDAPSIQSLFIRWTFRLIDIVTCLGSIAIFYILSTKYNQRLGDLLANTAVIKVKQSQMVSLKTFEDLKSHSHEVMFPSIVNYNDKDMLLVKDILRRIQTNNNPANQKAVNKIISKIKDELNIFNEELSKTEFLKQILNDYIFLTR